MRDDATFPYDCKGLAFRDFIKEGVEMRFEIQIFDCSHRRLLVIAM